jgi:hypothetical protein
MWWDVVIIVIPPPPHVIVLEGDMVTTMKTLQRNTRWGSQHNVCFIIILLKWIILHNKCQLTPNFPRPISHKYTNTNVALSSATVDEDQNLS